MIHHALAARHDCIHCCVLQLMRAASSSDGIELRRECLEEELVGLMLGFRSDE
jgi:hypothetical protein